MIKKIFNMFNNYEFKIKNILKKENNLELAENLCLEAIKKYPKMYDIKI